MSPSASSITHNEDQHNLVIQSDQPHRQFKSALPYADDLIHSSPTCFLHARHEVALLIQHHAQVSGILASSESTKGTTPAVSGSDSFSIKPGLTATSQKIGPQTDPWGHPFISEKKRDCKSNVVSRPLTPDMFEEDFPSVPETMNYPDVALQIESIRRKWEVVRGAGDDLETEESASPPSVAPWRGMAMSELKNRYSPGLPPVQASANHAVLFQLPVSPGCPLKPYPHVSKDRWDSLHVRMPSSSLSLYPVENAGKDGEEKQLRPRWELVQEALLKPIPSSKQLQDAIFSYNSKYSERWDFSTLHTFFSQFLAYPVMEWWDYVCVCMCMCEKVGWREAKTGEDSREAKTGEDSREAKTEEYSREAKTEDLKEAITGEDSNEAKIEDDLREAKTGEDSRETKTREESRKAKTGKDPREVKTGEESRETKTEVDSKEAKTEEAKTGEDSREAKTGEDSREAKTEEYSREAKTEDLKEAITGEDSNEAKIEDDLREAKTGEDSRETKTREESRKAKTGKDPREVKTGEESRETKTEVDSKEAKTEILGTRESTKFFSTLLPQIIGLALQLPSLVTGPIPLLVQHRNQSVSLTQLQVASLLANAFLCTFPRRNTAKRFSEYYKYPDINFNSTNSTVPAQFYQCEWYGHDTVPAWSEHSPISVNGSDTTQSQHSPITPEGVLTYSRQYLSSSQLPDWTSSKKFLPQLHISSSGTIEKEGGGFLQVDFANKKKNKTVYQQAPEGVLTYSRQYLSSSQLPDWTSSKKFLPQLHISSSGTIEKEGGGFLQVDFANKMVGGGVLGSGCVQEEIRFIICPELIVSRLFTEELNSTEALIVTGCERYSNYVGYGDTFEWLGDYVDTTPRDSSGRRLCTVAAIDALNLPSVTAQFAPNCLRRELNKAYTGFLGMGLSADKLSPVATGNWGCGAFRGDAHLKALLQLMAAGQADRDLVYFTFGDAQLRDDIYEIHAMLTNHGITVGELWHMLVQYNEHKYKEEKLTKELYPYLHKTVKYLSSTSRYNETLSRPGPSRSSVRKGISNNWLSGSISSHQNSKTGQTMLSASELKEALQAFTQEVDQNEDSMEDIKTLQNINSVTVLNTKGDKYRGVNTTYSRFSDVKEQCNTLGQCKNELEINISGVESQTNTKEKHKLIDKNNMIQLNEKEAHKSYSVKQGHKPDGHQDTRITAKARWALK
uniref:poly(ADP-ribose) glycohydrolase n=1 Tax=Timema cristinae TaxID=61476 RepID=A0A7R9GSK0_TIMCR|nr:unnamed protein product [Timema cristinae]